jgi:5-methylcytosine-specific restriction endonuclease McrA
MPPVVVPRGRPDKLGRVARPRLRQVRMSRYTTNERWKRVRRQKLALTPGCERCPEPATQVHHKDGRGLNGPHAYTLENLESLCQSCHSRETAGRRPTRRRPPEQHPGFIAAAAEAA